VRRAAVPIAFLASFSLITPIGVIVTPSPLPQAPLGAAARPLFRVAAVSAPPETAIRRVATARPAARAARVLMQAAGSTPQALAFTTPGGSTIARQYGVPLESRAEVNRLTVKSVVRIGSPPITVRSEPIRTAAVLAAVTQDAQARAKTTAPSAEILRQGVQAAPRTAKPAPQAAKAAGQPAAQTPASATADPEGKTQAASAVTHVVAAGQTLWKIASTYGVRVDDILAENGLRESAIIKPGQRLTIPTRGQQSRQSVVPRVRPGNRPPDDALMVDASVLQRSGPFLWPTRGVITSRFGWRRYRRHHAGMDLASPLGTPIYATREGVVTFSGWRNGYGKVIYIDHAGALETIYGHASALLVAVNQRVKRGQMIARVGCTGACTGSHVHFEVRINGTATDPLKYLR